MKWILGSVFKYYYDIRKDLSALHTFWNIINMKEVFILHKIYLCYQSKKNLSYNFFMSCNLYKIKSITKCSKHQLEYYPEELSALHNSYKYFQQKIYQFFYKVMKEELCSVYITSKKNWQFYIPEYGLYTCRRTVLHNIDTRTYCWEQCL